MKIIVFGNQNFMENLQKEFSELDTHLYFISHYHDKADINLIALRITNLTHLLIDGDMYNDVDLYYAIKTIKLLNPNVVIICVMNKERKLICHYLTVDELAYIVGTGIDIEHLFQDDFLAFNKSFILSIKNEKKIRKKFYKTGYDTATRKQKRGLKNGRKEK